MPRVKAGEMSLDEIRNIARQHNKVSVIKNIDKLSRKALIEEISKMGYNIDHENKKIVKNKMNRKVNKEFSVSKEGERKPQKKTKKKALIAGGDKPPMVKKKKPPPIKPALEKQRKKKEEKENKRKQLISGYKK
jgi:hypothetical protein